MILEAFANYLRAADPNIPATRVLGRWLWERLTLPAQNNVDKVIRHEIILSSQEKGDTSEQIEIPQLVFSAASESGERLLRSLWEYASSYEQQRWSRWVHCVKASDFTDSTKTSDFTDPEKD